ncbi:MAG: hypothetical protein ACR2FU_09770 [Streptosporangiaceae bacterium]
MYRSTAPSNVNAQTLLADVADADVTKSLAWPGNDRLVQCDPLNWYARGALVPALSNAQALRGPVAAAAVKDGKPDPATLKEVCHDEAAPGAALAETVLADTEFADTVFADTALADTGAASPAAPAAVIAAAAASLPGLNLRMKPSRHRPRRPSPRDPCALWHAAGRAA